MFNFIFLVLLFVLIGVLCWRLVVSKTRAHWIRVGAAGAAMITAVGALVVYDDLSDFKFKERREDIALLAACAGSFYLIGWTQRHGNRRHRTVSIIGLIPVVAAIATAMLFGGPQS